MSKEKDLNKKKEIGKKSENDKKEQVSKSKQTNKKVEKNTKKEIDKKIEKTNEKKSNKKIEKKDEKKSTKEVKINKETKSNKKIKLKKEKIFRFVSVIFLGFLFIFFSSRLVYNYILENVVNKNKPTSSLLSDKIILNINKENISYSGDKTILKGQINNNYISYSGILWRVIEVENGNIKMVTDDSVTLLPWGNNKKYEESNIYEWLNSENGLKNNLTDVNTYLEEMEYCINNTDEINITQCENKKEYISLLSMNDYIQIGANESYLNNNTYFWLAANNSENDPWYVFDNGGIETDNDNHIYGVRAVVTLKDIDYFYGNGTIDSPYLVSNEPVDNLSEIELGSFIDYSGYTWKVVGKTSTSIKLVLNNPLIIKNDEIQKIYSKKYPKFNLSDTNGIAYYLNNDFYKKLENKEYLVKEDFYIGKFSEFGLNELYEESVNTYVGLLTIGDIFLSENDDMYLLSSITDDNTIPVINKNDTIFYNLISYESNIKPVIYLNNEIEIMGGIGDINYPFELR